MPKCKRKQAPLTAQQKRTLSRIKRTYPFAAKAAGPDEQRRLLAINEADLAEYNRRLQDKDTVARMRSHSNGSW